MSNGSNKTIRHPAPDAGSERKAKIKEIFASIQGEGPYVGYKQLFIRFCGCNLKCNYCDTDFSASDDAREYSVDELLDEINQYSDIHSISLTGGEPLLSTEFLKEFLPKINNMHPLSKGGEQRSGGGILPKIYLETNATLTDKFLEVKPFVDIVSADIKLESATGIKDTFKFHDKFFEACRGVETFAKIVFNENITDNEIKKCCELGKKYGIELILQPEMILEDRKAGRQEGKPVTCHCDDDYLFAVAPSFSSKILDKFLHNYSKTRLVPQVHKFLNVR